MGPVQAEVCLGWLNGTAPDLPGRHRACHSVMRLTKFSRMTESAVEPTVAVRVSETIRRPSDVVAAYASDPSHAPDWYANIRAVEWKTPPPLRVGTQVAFVARFLGRELRYTYAVVEHTPQSLVMRTAQGPFPMETSYRYESLPDGSTRMTLQNRGTPSGFSHLMAPFMRLAIRRATRKDLTALKQILERGATAE